MKLSPKHLIFTAALAALIAFVVSGTNPTRFSGVAFAQSQPQSQMSQNAFKNIQVLKDIPVDEARLAKMSGARILLRRAATMK